MKNNFLKLHKFALSIVTTVKQLELHVHRA
jgi:hypothetical protein